MPIVAIYAAMVFVAVLMVSVGVWGFRRRVLA
jgi:hypothetical protein